MPNPAHCVIKSMDLFAAFSGLCIKDIRKPKEPFA